ncbi:uncharacterized protein LOC115825626 [Chanos chanos]|uniref:Uncharacterized protein LOC115825626 n=1 Tax=Chanos chanos TaxID=29144 RepID=A0A6J2WI99_CHACN|nr:uncharacterized protein LOC115825626 [Chanos chanos]
MEWCCCCFSWGSEANERQPLLGSNPQHAPASARQFHSPSNDNAQRSGGFTARHVGVPELDQRFADVAETFNQQHKNYEAMVESLNKLSYRYRCSSGSLSECIRNIKEDHDKYHIKLQMKGYDFSLAVEPADDVPVKLQRTQEDVRSLSQSAKIVVSKGTTLQELINWLLKAEQNLIQQVREAAPNHQEETRLGDNLRENLRETRRVKELSPCYREEAGKLLNEAALLSGVSP